MAQTVMIAEYDLAPGTQDEFLSVMAEYAREALDHFEGLEQFDVLAATDRSDLAFAYEVFRDDAAYAAYKASGWVERIRERYGRMVRDRRIVKCRRP